MSTYTLTSEQQNAVDLARTGGNMVIEAFAGAGKTSTLVSVAEALRGRGVYTAFNRAIIEDGKGRFPNEVQCRTMHSLAFGAVGKSYKHRLDARRRRNSEIAQILGIDGIAFQVGDTRKVIDAGRCAALVMRTINEFCQSDAMVPTVDHVPYQDGIDEPDPATGRRGWTNNRVLRAHVEPFLMKAWLDLVNPGGHLPFGHACQPPGTMVRRVTQYGGGVSGTGVYEDVPIEKIEVGDRVVSFTMTKRRGYVRRAGRLVTAAGNRPFDGQLVVVTTERGRVSRYTPDHRCVVRMDVDLDDGNFVVYLARRGDNYRVGRTTWRTRSQSNTLGLRRRAESQQADALWVLSVHETDEEAALAEALAAHRFNIPTWQFQSLNEKMPLDLFWREAGANHANAEACLDTHGKALEFPFWERGDGWENTTRPVVLRAVNILSGMMVCEVDEIVPGKRNELSAHHGSGGWAPVTVGAESYRGLVYNLEVETDHTYVADGIATHNCYLKMWAVGNPRIPGDFILFDEAQDASQVFLQVLRQQDHAQMISVGDSQQAIYGSFLGTSNALEVLPSQHRAWLTQSFRFGERVAAIANEYLDLLGVEHPLIGNPRIDSRVGPIAAPTAILCRTNAAVIESAILSLEAGRKVAVVGGVDELVSFAEGAQALQAGARTDNFQLACFDTWKEVVDYVENDPNGGELKLLVKLMDDFTPEKIIDAMGRVSHERAADVTISTAHRSKGRQWSQVRVADGFAEPDPDTGEFPHAEELRLQYVAGTRAQHGLDPEGLFVCNPMFGREALFDQLVA